MTMLSIEPQHSNEHWTRIAHHAPVLAVTCQDYVAQISVTMRPSTTEGVDRTLRIFSDWLIDHDPTVIACCTAPGSTGTAPTPPAGSSRTRADRCQSTSFVAS